MIGLSVVLVALVAGFAASKLLDNSSPDDSEADGFRADGVFAICSEPNGGLTLDGDTLISEYPSNERTDEYVRVRDCLVRQTLMPSDIEYKMMHAKGDEGPGGDQWPGWSATWEYTVTEGLALRVTSE